MENKEQIKKEIYQTIDFIKASLEKDSLSHCEYYRDLMTHLLNKLINEKNKQTLC